MSDKTSGLNATNTEDLVGFAHSSELDSDVDDAYIVLPDMAAMRTESLPLSSYTLGDTSGTPDSDFPEHLLASLPSRVSRRFVAADHSELTSAVTTPAPSFVKIERDVDLNSQQVIPTSVQRIAKISDIQQQNTKRIKEDNRAAIERAAQNIVSTPPDAAALLKAMGLPVTREARISEMKAQQDFNSSQDQVFGDIAEEQQLFSSTADRLTITAQSTMQTNNNIAGNIVTTISQSPSSLTSNNAPLLRLKETLEETLFSSNPVLKSNTIQSINTDGVLAKSGDEQVSIVKKK